MSFHIELDSLRRDPQTYPNPANYSLSGSDISTWPRYLKTIKGCTSMASVPSRSMSDINYDRGNCHGNTLHKVCDSDYFKVELKDLTLPFPRADIIDDPIVLEEANDILLSQPRLYVDIHSSDYNDNFLLQTIGGYLPTAKFAVILDKIQTGVLPTGGDPLNGNEYTNGSWLHYKSLNTQVMRFKPGDTLTFTVYDRFGNIIPYFTDPSTEQDPEKQILATFSFCSCTESGCH